MKPYIITVASRPRIRRWTALLTCVLFLQNTLLPSAQAGGISIEGPSEHASVTLPSDFASVQLPSEIGKLDDSFSGTSGFKVIIVQDAHAIPDAQRSIRKAILYFYQKYGVNLVALEGASSRLDARMLKSFPDKERLNKVLSSYFDAGELAGGTAAAIAGIKMEDQKASGSRLIFQGVEDWPVYEEALGLYIQAMEKEKDVLQEVDGQRLKLEEEKQNSYSAELLKADRAVSSFRDNSSDFLKTLEALASVKAPEQGSELALLLEQGQKEKQAPAEDSSAEVRALSLKVEAYFKTVALSAEMRDVQSDFQGKKQQFQTSQISPEAFALSLKTIAAKAGIPIQVSDRLLGLVRKEKRMADIEGTKLFSDFEVYAQGVKESLFRNEQDRLLDERDRRLWLALKLTRLEVSYQDWVELEQMRLDGTWSVDGLKMNSMESLFEPHFAFYKNAQKRDEIFFKNLTAQLKNLKAAGRSAVMVAGGFHAHGLCSLLREQGISYALVMPEIQNLPAESHYRQQMRGDFSWKNYFEVENGKVNVYNAFIRGTRDRLLNTTKDETPDRGLLKSWRDQIIRDLADEGRVETAGEYTRFIDELAGDKQAQAMRKRLAQVKEFLEDLRMLDARGEFTAANIAKLFQPSLATTLTGASLDSTVNVGRQSLPARFPAAFTKTAVAQSEVRQGETLEKMPWQMTREEFSREVVFHGAPGRASANIEKTGKVYSQGALAQGADFTEDFETASGYAKRKITADPGFVFYTTRANVGLLPKGTYVDAAERILSEADPSTKAKSGKILGKIPPYTEDPYRYIVEQAQLRGEKVSAGILESVQKTPSLSIRDAAAPQRSIEAGQSSKKILAQSEVRANAAAITQGLQALQTQEGLAEDAVRNVLTMLVQPQSQQALSFNAVVFSRVDPVLRANGINTQDPKGLPPDQITVLQQVLEPYNSRAMQLATQSGEARAADKRAQAKAVLEGFFGNILVPQGDSLEEVSLKKLQKTQERITTAISELPNDESIYKQDPLYLQMLRLQKNVLAEIRVRGVIRARSLSESLNASMSAQGVTDNLYIREAVRSNYARLSAGTKTPRYEYAVDPNDAQFLEAERIVLKWFKQNGVSISDLYLVSIFYEGSLFEAESGDDAEAGFKKIKGTHILVRGDQVLFGNVILQLRKQGDEFQFFDVRNSETVYPLALKENSVGRFPGSAVLIEGSEVSRKHALVHVDLTTGLVRVTDLGSSNGTLVKPVSRSEVRISNQGELLSLRTNAGRLASVDRYLMNFFKGAFEGRAQDTIRLTDVGVGLMPYVLAETTAKLAETFPDKKIQTTGLEIEDVRRKVVLDEPWLNPRYKGHMDQGNHEYESILLDSQNRIVAALTAEDDNAVSAESLAEDDGGEEQAHLEQLVQKALNQEKGFRIVENPWQAFLDDQKMAGKASAGILQNTDYRKAPPANLEGKSDIVRIFNIPSEIDYDALSRWVAEGGYAVVGYSPFQTTLPMEKFVIFQKKNGQLTPVQYVFSTSINTNTGPEWIDKDVFREPSIFVSLGFGTNSWKFSRNLNNGFVDQNILNDAVLYPSWISLRDDADFNQAFSKALEPWYESLKPMLNRNMPDVDLDSPMLLLMGLTAKTRAFLEMKPSEQFAGYLRYVIQQILEFFGFNRNTRMSRYLRAESLVRSFLYPFIALAFKLSARQTARQFEAFSNAQLQRMNEMWLQRAVQSFNDQNALRERFSAELDSASGYVVVSPKARSEVRAVQRNPYEVLGVTKDTSVKDIKAQYRKLAKQYHPDRNPEEEKEAAALKFIEVQEAWDILGDAEKKKAFDRASGGAAAGSRSSKAKPAAASAEAPRESQRPADQAQPRRKARTAAERTAEAEQKKFYQKAYNLLKDAGSFKFPSVFDRLDLRYKIGLSEDDFQSLYAPVALIQLDFVGLIQKIREAQMEPQARTSGKVDRLFQEAKREIVRLQNFQDSLRYSMDFENAAAADALEPLIDRMEKIAYAAFSGVPYAPKKAASVRLLEPGESIKVNHQTPVRFELSTESKIIFKVRSLNAPRSMLTSARPADFGLEVINGVGYETFELQWQDGQLRIGKVFPGRKTASLNIISEGRTYEGFVENNGFTVSHDGQKVRVDVTSRGQEVLIKDVRPRTRTQRVSDESQTPVSTPAAEVKKTGLWNWILSMLPSWAKPKGGGSAKSEVRTSERSSEPIEVEQVSDFFKNVTASMRSFITPVSSDTRDLEERFLQLKPVLSQALAEVKTKSISVTADSDEAIVQGVYQLFEILQDVEIALEGNGFTGAFGLTHKMPHGKVISQEGATAVGEVRVLAYQLAAASYEYLASTALSLLSRTKNAEWNNDLRQMIGDLVGKALHSLILAGDENVEIGRIESKLDYYYAAVQLHQEFESFTTSKGFGLEVRELLNHGFPEGQFWTYVEKTVQRGDMHDFGKSPWTASGHESEWFFQIPSSVNGAPVNVKMQGDFTVVGTEYSDAQMRLIDALNKQYRIRLNQLLGSAEDHALPLEVILDAGYIEVRSSLGLSFPGESIKTAKKDAVIQEIMLQHSPVALARALQDIIRTNLDFFTVLVRPDTLTHLKHYHEKLKKANPDPSNIEYWDDGLLLVHHSTHISKSEEEGTAGKNLEGLPVLMMMLLTATGGVNEGEYKPTIRGMHNAEIGSAFDKGSMQYRWRRNEQVLGYSLKTALTLDPAKIVGDVQSQVAQAIDGLEAVPEIQQTLRQELARIEDARKVSPAELVSGLYKSILSWYQKSDLNEYGRSEEDRVEDVETFPTLGFDKFMANKLYNQYIAAIDQENKVLTSTKAADAKLPLAGTSVRAIFKAVIENPDFAKEFLSLYGDARLYLVLLAMVQEGAFFPSPKYLISPQLKASANGIQQGKKGSETFKLPPKGNIQMYLGAIVSPIKNKNSLISLELNYLTGRRDGTAHSIRVELRDALDSDRIVASDDIQFGDEAAITHIYQQIFMGQGSSLEDLAYDKYIRKLPNIAAQLNRSEVRAQPVSAETQLPRRRFLGFLGAAGALALMSNPFFSFPQQAATPVTLENQIVGTARSAFKILRNPALSPLGADPEFQALFENEQVMASLANLKVKPLPADALPGARGWQLNGEIFISEEFVKGLQRDLAARGFDLSGNFLSVDVASLQARAQKIINDPNQGFAAYGNSFEFHYATMVLMPIMDTVVHELKHVEQHFEGKLKGYNGRVDDLHSGLMELGAYELGKKAEVGTARLFEAQQDFTFSGFAEHFFRDTHAAEYAQRTANTRDAALYFLKKIPQSSDETQRNYYAAEALFLIKTLLHKAPAGYFQNNDELNEAIRLVVQQQKAGRRLSGDLARGFESLIPGKDNSTQAILRGLDAAGITAQFFDRFLKAQQTAKSEVRTWGKGFISDQAAEDYIAAHKPEFRDLARFLLQHITYIDQAQFDTALVTAVNSFLVERKDKPFIVVTSKWPQDKTEVKSELFVYQQALKNGLPQPEAVVEVENLVSWLAEYSQTHKDAPTPAILILDDASYSGSQLNSFLSRLQNNFSIAQSNALDIHLLVPFTTALAIETINSSRYSSYPVHFHTAQTIKMADEIFEEEKERAVEGARAQIEKLHEQAKAAYESLDVTLTKLWFKEADDASTLLVLSGVVAARLRAAVEVPQVPFLTGSRRWDTPYKNNDDFWEYLQNTGLVSSSAKSEVRTQTPPLLRQPPALVKKPPQLPLGARVTGYLEKLVSLVFSSGRAGGVNSPASQKPRIGIGDIRKGPVGIRPPKLNARSEVRQQKMAELKKGQDLEVRPGQIVQFGSAVYRFAFNVYRDQADQEVRVWSLQSLDGLENFDLTEPEMYLGRGWEGISIQLTDLTVSKKHALLTRDDNGSLTLTALETSNGTRFLPMGVPVSAPHFKAALTQARRTPERFPNLSIPRVVQKLNGLIMGQAASKIYDDSPEGVFLADTLRPKVVSYFPEELDLFIQEAEKVFLKTQEQRTESIQKVAAKLLQDNRGDPRRVLKALAIALMPSEEQPEAYQPVIEIIDRVILRELAKIYPAGHPTSTTRDRYIADLSTELGSREAASMLSQRSEVRSSAAESEAAAVTPARLSTRFKAAFNNAKLEMADDGLTLRYLQLDSRRSLVEIYMKLSALRNNPDPADISILNLDLYPDKGPWSSSLAVNRFLKGFLGIRPSRPSSKYPQTAIGEVVDNFGAITGTDLASEDFRNAVSKYAELYTQRLEQEAIIVTPDQGDLLIQTEDQDLTADLKTSRQSSDPKDLSILPSKAPLAEAEVSYLSSLVKALLEGGGTLPEGVSLLGQGKKGDAYSVRVTINGRERLLVIKLPGGKDKIPGKKDQMALDQLRREAVMLRLIEDKGGIIGIPRLLYEQKDEAGNVVASVKEFVEGDPLPLAIAKNPTPQFAEKVYQGWYRIYDELQKKVGAFNGDFYNLANFLVDEKGNIGFTDLGLVFFRTERNVDEAPRSLPPTDRVRKVGEALLAKQQATLSSAAAPERDFSAEAEEQALVETDYPVSDVKTDSAAAARSEVRSASSIIPAAVSEQLAAAGKQYAIDFLNKIMLRPEMQDYEVIDATTVGAKHPVLGIKGVFSDVFLIRDKRDQQLRVLKIAGGTFEGEEQAKISLAAEAQGLVDVSKLLSDSDPFEFRQLIAIVNPVSDAGVLSQIDAYVMNYVRDEDTSEILALLTKAESDPDRITPQWTYDTFTAFLDFLDQKGWSSLDIQPDTFRIRLSNKKFILMDSGLLLPEKRTEVQRKVLLDQFKTTFKLNLEAAPAAPAQSSADAKSEVRVEQVADAAVKKFGSYAAKGSPSIAEIWNEIGDDLLTMKGKTLTEVLDRIESNLQSVLNPAAAQNTVDAKVTSQLMKALRQRFFAGSDKSAGAAFGFQILNEDDLARLANVAREIAAQFSTSDITLLLQADRGLRQKGMGVIDRYSRGVKVVPLGKIQNVTSPEVYFGPAQRKLLFITDSLDLAVPQDIDLVGAVHDTDAAAVVMPADLIQAQALQSFLIFMAAIELSGGQSTAAKLNKNLAETVQKMSQKAALIDELPDVYQINKQGRVVVSDNAVLSMLQILTTAMKARAEVRQAA